MKINENTSYPYPIWSQNDDYKEKIQVSACHVEEAHDKDNYIFNLDFDNTNEDIVSLIEKDLAVYVCSAYCSETFSLFKSESKSSSFSISIPRKKVFGRVELQWIILAKKDISDFKSESLNEDYQGVVSFPAGAMIAEIGVYRFDTTISDEQRSLGDIFAVVLNPDDDGIRYNFDNDKLRIMLPQRLLEEFNSIDYKYHDTLHATIVYQALLTALSKIHNMQDDDKLWVSILTDIIEDFEDVGNVGDDENGFSFEDCVKIADHILQHPIERMFEELAKLEKTNDTDE